jgi:hypothetical protein
VAPLACLADTEASLVRIPLAVTGKWVRGASELSITLRDLEAISRNFQERLNGEINVDYDHASEMPEVAGGGPIPSAGRIVKLDPPAPMNGSRKSGVGSGKKPAFLLPVSYSRFILYGWYEPTERARLLIQHHEYRYISPAIDWAARNKRSGQPQGATLTSVALTNRPFLEEMPPIQLSDPAYELVGEHLHGAPEKRGGSQGPSPTKVKLGTEPTGGPMKQVTLSVVDGKIKIAHADLNEEFFASPEDLRKCLEEMGLLSDATLAATLQTLAGRPGAALSECVVDIGQRLMSQQQIHLSQATTLLSEAEAQGKSVSALEFFRAEVERELDTAVKAGKLLPRQRDDWRKIALSDLPTFRRIVATQKPLVPLRPVGLTGTGPDNVQAQVKILAEQRVRERNISFGQALSEIGRELPELVQQYRRAVSAAD